MDIKTLALIAVSIASSVIGWFVRVLWEAQDRLRSDFQKLESGLPRVYVSKDDYRDDMRDQKEQLREIKDMVSKIFDRLENKADK